jgi:hypothetical protein
MPGHTRKPATRKGPRDYIKLRFLGITIECRTITTKAIIFLIIVLIFFILVLVMLPNFIFLKKNWYLF